MSLAMEFKNQINIVLIHFKHSPYKNNNLISFLFVIHKRFNYFFGYPECLRCDSVPFLLHSFWQWATFPEERENWWCTAVVLARLILHLLIVSPFGLKWQWHQCKKKINKIKQLKRELNLYENSCEIIANCC